MQWNKVLSEYEYIGNQNKWINPGIYISLLLTMYYVSNTFQFTVLK